MKRYIFQTMCVLSLSLLTACGGQESGLSLDSTGKAEESDRVLWGLSSWDGGAVPDFTGYYNARQELADGEYLLYQNFASNLAEYAPEPGSIRELEMFEKLKVEACEDASFFISYWAADNGCAVAEIGECQTSTAWYDNGPYIDAIGVDALITAVARCSER